MGPAQRRPRIAGQAAMLLLLVLLLAASVAPRGVVPAFPTPWASHRPHTHASEPAVAAAVSRARHIADTAPGQIAFALVLPSGRVVGEHLDQTFTSASLSKSLLAIALLRSPTLSADPSALADGERMIRFSDNEAATRTMRRLGAPAVRAAAGAAGLEDFAIAASWSEARVSARDFARVLVEAPRLVLPENRRRLRAWLEGVSPSQSWGIPEALRPLGAHVLFKGGWRGGLTHQAARVEIGRRVYGLAVLSDRQPSGLASGAPTITRLARTLLGPGSTIVHQ